MAIRLLNHKRFLGWCQRYQGKRHANSWNNAFLSIPVGSHGYQESIGIPQKMNEEYSWVGNFSDAYECLYCRKRHEFTQKYAIADEYRYVVYKKPTYKKPKNKIIPKPLDWGYEKMRFYCHTNSKGGYCNGFVCDERCAIKLDNQLRREDQWLRKARVSLKQVRKWLATRRAEQQSQNV